MRSERLLFAARIVGFLVLGTFLASSAQAQFTYWHWIFHGQGECVGMNPINPNTVFAQGNDNWLYVSHDAGMSWSQLSSGIGFETREIIVHPRDTLSMFAADEDGEGLLRSTDGGVSWTSVIPNYVIDGESVSYDPVHPDTMWAGNFSDGKIYRSINRGATWTNPGTSNSDMCTLQVRPDSSQILYAGTGASSISKSTNGGVTWIGKKSSDANGSAETPRIVVNPNNPLIAYATSYNDASTPSAVWKSTNGGESWSQTSLSSSFISGLLVWSLEIDEQHPDTLYSGTFTDNQASVYRTTDAGATWTSISNGFYAQNSMWNMKIDPHNPANVYVSVTAGSFGSYGIFKLTSADAEISGTVRDSATSAPIGEGYAQIFPSGDYVDLSFTGGGYSFFRPAYDTASTYTMYIYINNQLAGQTTANFSHGANTSQDIQIVRGSIAGVVFNDLNGNGVQDAGEPGIPNWPVDLTGQSSAGHLTDAGGNFLFSSLDVGSYTVSEKRQYGFTQTTPVSNGGYSISVTNVSKFSTTNNFGNHRGHTVSATWPKAFSTTNDPAVQIRVLLDTSFISSTFDDTVACVVTGAQSGRHRGTFSFDGDTAIFTPQTPFFRGETVRMTVGSRVKSADNFSIIPYTLDFNIRSTAGTGDLALAGTYTTGSTPYAVAAADLNGDGYTDFAVANTGSNSVSVFINNGDGTFAPKADYPVGSSPKSVAIADVNNDGLPDIIVGNSGAGNFSLLKNVGSGIFDAHVDFSSGGASFGIAAADMNGDGYVDVVTIVPGLSGVYVATNDGTGAFTSPTGSSTSGQPQGGFVADINGDGGLDIALTIPNNSSSIVTKENVGGGLLQTSGTLTAGSFSHGVCIADLNGDRLPDIITSNGTSNNISIFTNTGSGLYGSGAAVSTGTYPYGVACADIDGDSLVDIVTTNVTGTSITVLHNNGGGSYSRTDYTVGNSPTGAAIADFNGDGKPDVVVVNSGSGNASVFLNSSILSVYVRPSWNLVSVPQVLPNLLKSSVYPTASSQAFGYKTGYIVKDTLVVGQGYWLKFDSAAALGFGGTSVSPETVSVNAGWNLVGAMGVPVDTSAVSTEPYGDLLTGFFGYNNGYTTVDSLTPGSGYWVKVAHAGMLILSSQHAAPKAHHGNLQSPAFSSVRIEDEAGHAQTLYFRTGIDPGTPLSRYEMPPAPPAGAFDARFADQTIAKIVDPSVSGEFAIDVEGAAGELRVTADIQTDEHGVWALANAGDPHPLGGKESFAVSNSGKLSLVVSSASSATPRTFALAQNYPNPFNPSTTIRFDVAAPAHVSLVLHDVLGREVATLVDKQVSAGSYSVRWDAGGLAAGVYYATMLAHDASGAELFRTVKKLMLVK